MKKSGKPPKNYTIGYGKPPTERQFKKGQSGNKRGRPKGTKPAPLLPAKTINDILLQEAQRMVRAREGDQIVEMPAIQAVIRKMHIDAAQGNRQCQKMLISLTQAKEAEDAAEKQKLFEAAVLHRDNCLAEFKYCRDHGLPEPEVNPHPDDIEIDVRVGEARFTGPITDQEAEHCKMIFDVKAEIEEELSCLQKKARRPPRNTGLQQELKRQENLYAFACEAYAHLPVGWRTREEMKALKSKSETTALLLEKSQPDDK